MTPPAGVRDPQVVVPFYVHPVAGPQAWADLARRVGQVHRLVVNVHNGPGAELDVSYVPALASVPAQIGLVGYVPLSYGRRRPDDVRRDAAVWRDRYGVTALMLDEVPTAVGEHDRLARLVADLRADGAVEVIGNPGTVPLVLEQLDVFDLTCVFEGTCADYVGWTGEDVAHLASRTWHLVHSCEAGHARHLVDLARRRGAGGLWVSTDRLPHPWAGLNEELLAWFDPAA